MKGWIATLIVLAAVIAIASTCFVAVDETEFVIVKQFGKPVRTYLDPGLRLKWPVPIETTVRFDNRIQVFEDPPADTPAKEYLTRDKKNVEVATFTCWRIERSEGAVLKFLETVRDKAGAEPRLGDIIRSQLNAKLGSSDFNPLVTTDASSRRWREIVGEILNESAQRARDSFGIEIADLQVQRFNFPAQNRRSVFDRMRAERQRIATKYRSEGEAESMRIRANAQAEQEKILAEAYAESQRIRGQADAEATRIYGEAYNTDPEFYRFLRTLESYETGLDADTILILPSDAPFFRLLTNPNAPVEQLPKITIENSLTKDGRDKQQTTGPEG